MPKTRNLTIKQRKFVKEIAKTGNGTQAILKAYETIDYDTAKSMAAENLAKPYIKAAVEEEFRKEDLTVSWVLKGLKKEAETGEQPAPRVKSYELIGKHLKMFDGDDVTWDINLKLDL